MPFDKLMQRAQIAAKRLDRVAAREAIIQLIGMPAKTPDQWRRLIEIAQALGEAGAAVESARKFAATDANSLQRRLIYCETLAEFGREEQALALIRELPEDDRKQPAAQYLEGLLHAQVGEFDAAERALRAVIDAGIAQDAAWFTLSSIKRFSKNDPDLSEMRILADSLEPRDPRRFARIAYAIGKAEWDIGEHERAYETYCRGARAQRSVLPYDSLQHEGFVQRVITGFSMEGFGRMSPSSAIGSRALFVTGAPRSGTTLAERLLSAHPDVTSGGEIDLWGHRLLQTHTPDTRWAMNVDAQGKDDNAWEQLATSYTLSLWTQFPHGKFVIDKSLLQTQWMGILLHSLPDAKVVYITRDVADVAWSCFRSYFPQSLAWTNDLREIGRYLAAEAALLDHWKSIFGSRILTVAYEDLVERPMSESERMMNHFGLRPPGGEVRFDRLPAHIKTASLHQARQPVHTESVGNSGPIRERMLEEVMAGMRESPFRTLVHA